MQLRYGAVLVPLIMGVLNIGYLSNETSVLYSCYVHTQRILEMCTNYLCNKDTSLIMTVGPVSNCPKSSHNRQVSPVKR